MSILRYWDRSPFKVGGGDVTYNYYEALFEYDFELESDFEYEFTKES